MIILVIFGGLFFYLNNNDSDNIKFKNEYESLNGTKNDSGKTIRSISISQDNPFRYANEVDIVDMINDKKSFLVYFGFAKCPWCRSVLPNLVRALKDYNIDTIYYVDVYDIRDIKELDDDGNIKTSRDGSDGYMKLLELLDNVLADYNLTDKDGNKISTGEKRIYAPNVVAIVNGKAVKLVEGISEKQTDAYMKLTKEMNEESYNQFVCAINCLLDKKNICTNDKKC